MKTVTKFVLVICILIVSFCSCTRIEMLSNDEYVRAFSHQVPFAQFDPKADFFEEVEKDSYGRKLFYCELTKFSNVLLDSCGSYETCFYIISQGKANDAIMFYDTDCYLFVPKGTKATDASVIELKNKNDWNHEKNQEKMIAVSTKERYYLNDQEFKEIVTYVEKNDQLNSLKFVLDVLYTANNKKFYILRQMVEQQATYTYENTYLFTIVDGKISNLSEIEGTPVEWKEQIREYKTFLDEN